jgi:hypothetical protein
MSRCAAAAPIKGLSGLAVVLGFCLQIVRSDGRDVLGDVLRGVLGGVLCGVLCGVVVANTSYTAGKSRSSRYAIPLCSRISTPEHRNLSMSK